MDKKNVLVIMGGMSSERDISIYTGKMIEKYLNKEKYNVFCTEVDKEGYWLLNSVTGTEQLRVCSNNEKELVLKSSNVEKIVSNLSIDVVFIALHGKYGEDGTLQGMLELLKIPYTGSGVLASALAMDKLRSRQLFQANGLDVPAYISCPRSLLKEEKVINEFVKEAANKLKFPCIVKPNDGGSSIGIFLVKEEEQLKDAINKACEYGDIILIEEYIKGTEISVGVFDDPENITPVAFPVIEIVPKSEWFDYESKYQVGGSEEIIPARISDEFTSRAKEIGIKAHLILGCKGLSRTDMIIKDNRLYVLETNTLPGMTETSLYPQAAKAVGIDFSTLLDKLIKIAIHDK